MIRWLIVAIVLACAVGSLPGRIDRAVRREVSARENDSANTDARYRDFGVLLHVVKMDLAGGVEMIDGAPPLAVVRSHRLGGMVDTWGKRPSICGPSTNPTIWYCSEDAEPIVLHGDEMPDRLLVYGSEGAGKTRVLAQWLGLRVIEATGSKSIHGLTSPTEKRAEEIREAIAEMWPSHWFSWHERRRMYVIANGERAQVVSTYQQSKKAGSRIQGFNWRDAASDEIQDSLEKDADIEMRGRKAPLGIYKRLCTATSKDSPDFRDWRDKRLATTKWQRRTLLGTRSPFIWPAFWAEKAETLDKREYRRRVLAEDLPPENRVYYGFERERNIVAMSDAARDVSAEVLGMFRPIGRNHGTFALLAGHDPGEIRNVTTFLRPYLHRSQLTWLVVGRHITERTTAEQHAASLLRHVQSVYGLNYETDARDRNAMSDRVLVVCDPHGRGETKTDYDTVYQAFIDAGVDCFNAAGSEEVIKSRARRDMMNRLMMPEVGAPRLCVATMPDGSIAAPELVAAFEQLERDRGGQAEKGRKNEHDQTHHPVSVGYGLWPFEAPSVSAITKQRLLGLVRGQA